MHVPLGCPLWKTFDNITVLHSEEHLMSDSGFRLIIPPSPDHELPLEKAGIIEYGTLQAWHLPQVHDLLRRTFWDGIDGVCSIRRRNST